MENSSIGALQMLGAGVQRVQQRFISEDLPMGVTTVITADGGILVQVGFLGLMDGPEFPIAWDEYAGFETTTPVTSQLFAFADDPRPVHELLAERAHDLQLYVRGRREEDSAIDELLTTLEDLRNGPPTPPLTSGYIN